MRPETETQDKMLQTRPKTTPKVDLILMLIVIVIAMMMMICVSKNLNMTYTSVGYHTKNYNNQTNMDEIFDTT